MAEGLQPLTSQKHKFTFKFCIQSLKLTFKDDVVCTSTPVAITLTKRGHTITTDYAPLTKQAPPQECCFTATWKDGVMQVTVSLYALEGGAFESQKIKICLLPDSGSQGKENKSKILASCRLDLSNLRLQCNGDEVCEKKMLLLNPVKAFTAVVASAELLLDVTHWCVKSTRPTRIVPSPREIHVASNGNSPCSSPETPSSPLIAAPPKPKRSWATLDDVVHTAYVSSATESTDAGPSNVVNAPRGESKKLEKKSKESPRQKRGRSHSLADLLKPSRNAVKDDLSKKHSNTGAEGTSYFGSHDLLGLLRVKTKGITLPDDIQLSLTSDESELSPDAGSPDSHQSASRATENSIYCVFTVNGGNTRAKSSVVPVLPNRPIVYDDDEPDRLFYTNQSRQLFILCRKVITDNRQLQRVSPSILLETDSDKNDTCIGAAILQLTDCPTPATPLDPIRESEVTLPLQPKGSIQLAMSFSPLVPRCRVVCEGTITVLRAQDIFVPPLNDCEISCTVKLDVDMIDSTSPAPVGECSTEGWSREALKFISKKNLDIDIQLWAYSEDGTTAWCGISILPLAYIIPMDVAKERKELLTSSYGEHLIIVSKQYKERLVVEVEPQGELDLLLCLSPCQQSVINAQLPGWNSSEAATDVVKREAVVPKPTANQSKSLRRTASMRRKKMHAIQQPPDATVLAVTPRDSQMSDRDASASKKQLSKSGAPSGADLEQENLDLKREIEYLREELRKVRSELSECVFFKEQAEAQLKSLQGGEKKRFNLFGNRKKKDDRKEGKKGK